MNISQAAKKTELTAATLRYYERLGLIPPVTRKNGGVRDYSESDLQWIDFIKCMKRSGLSIEALIEYTALYQDGESTKEARKQLLKEEREQLLARYQELGETLKYLDHKIENYDEM